MCFQAWHRVYSAEILAPSVTEMLATHVSYCGDGGNIPLSYHLVNFLTLEISKRRI